MLVDHVLALFQVFQSSEKFHLHLPHQFKAHGYPRPAITWTRAAMPLPAGKTSINQGTLTINNLSPADNGFYDCAATNIMGTEKKRINLAVQVHRSGLY